MVNTISMKNRLFWTKITKLTMKFFLEDVRILRAKTPIKFPWQINLSLFFFLKKNLSQRS